MPSSSEPRAWRPAPRRSGRARVTGVSAHRASDVLGAAFRAGLVDPRRVDRRRRTGAGARPHASRRGRRRPDRPRRRSRCHRGCAATLLRRRERRSRDRADPARSAHPLVVRRHELRDGDPRTCGPARRLGPARGIRGYVPTSPAEVAALRPEYVIIGHAHFDHAADAVPIAQATGATLVGTAEHCDDFRSRAESGPPVECVAAIPAGAPPGTSAPVELLDGVKITALEHIHSAAGLTDASDGFHVPALPPPLVDPILEHPPTPEDLLGLLGHLPDAEGGTVLYRFDLATCRSSGTTRGPASQPGARCARRPRADRPVDIEVGAIQGFGQFTNGSATPATTSRPCARRPSFPRITTTGRRRSRPRAPCTAATSTASSLCGLTRSRPRSVSSPILRTTYVPSR